MHPNTDKYAEIANKEMDKIDAQEKGASPVGMPDTVGDAADLGLDPAEAADLGLDFAEAEDLGAPARFSWPPYCCVRARVDTHVQSSPFVHHLGDVVLSTRNIYSVLCEGHAVVRLVATDVHTAVVGRGGSVSRPSAISICKEG